MLAQEVMLDELLETEDVIKQGSVWSKDQHGEVRLPSCMRTNFIWNRQTSLSQWTLSISR